MYSQMVYGGPPLELRYYCIDTHRHIRGIFRSTRGVARRCSKQTQIPLKALLYLRFSHLRVCPLGSLRGSVRGVWLTGICV